MLDTRTQSPSWRHLDHHAASSRPLRLVFGSIAWSHIPADYPRPCDGQWRGKPILRDETMGIQSWGNSRGVSSVITTLEPCYHSNWNGPFWLGSMILPVHTLKIPLVGSKLNHATPLPEGKMPIPIQESLFTTFLGPRLSAFLNQFMVQNKGPPTIRIKCVAALHTKCEPLGTLNQSWNHRVMIPPTLCTKCEALSTTSLKAHWQRGEYWI